MTVHAFDTLTQAENLQKYGFGEQQAKGLIEVIALSTNNLATKQDLTQMKLEIRLEVHQECTGLREELRSSVQQLDNKIRQLDNKILRMTISVAGVNVVALGAFTSFLQWLH